MGIATREAYGQVLKELAENKDIVVLDADLGKATKVYHLKLPQIDFLTWG